MLTVSREVKKAALGVVAFALGLAVALCASDGAVTHVDMDDHIVLVVMP